MLEIYIGFFLLFLTLGIIWALWNYHFENIGYKLVVSILCAVFLAFAVVLLSNKIEPIFWKLVTSNATAQTLSLTIFSLVTSILVALSLFVIGNFETRRKDLESKINSLSNNISKTDSYIAKSIENEKNIIKDQLLSNYLQSRITVYFYIFNELGELAQESVNHKSEIALKLLHSVVSRDKLSDLNFDLQEISSYLYAHNDIANSISRPSILKYFEDLRDFLPFFESDSSIENRDPKTKEIIRFIDKIIASLS